MKRAALTIGLIVAAIAARADTFDRQVASIVLLQNQQVQKELKITETQRTKMNTFAEAFNKEQKAYIEKLEKASNGGKTQPKRDTAKEMAMVNSLKTKVLSLLTEKQVVRLRQISLQAIGVAALADDTVAKRIGLNKTQIDKIRSIVQKGLDEGQKISDGAMAEAQKGIKKPTNEAEQKKASAEFDKKWKVYGPPAQKKLNAVRTRTISDVMTVLTSGQKATWTSLTGPIFKVT